MTKIVLATLCLNELEWLPRLIKQHRNWPGAVGWVFVEAADRVYAKANPDRVSPNGLSVDGTTELLGLGQDAGDIHHLTVGLVGGDDPAQGKCEARSMYCEYAEGLEPDWLIVLDADEFYTNDDQEVITGILDGIDEQVESLEEYRPSILFAQRHIWRPPSIEHMPLLSYEAVRGYWSVPHVRAWPWYPGMRYVSNHNHPELPDGTSLRDGMIRLESPDSPQCVHMGFAAALAGRQAKHRYYVERGEGPKDGRQGYVECRAAWEVWKPGDELPQGAKVVRYSGPVPEVFEEW